MVDPLSVVALSLTCLHGCIKGIVIMSKAQSYSQNVSDAQFRTKLILHSLTTWAQEAGLTQDPPKLLVNANDTTFVLEILRQLEALFTDINELRTRYGTYLQPTEEEIDVEFDDDDDTVPLKLGGTRRKWTERVDVAVYLKKAQPWKRLRWITLDEEKFERLLEKANSYVDQLGKFLEQARQKRMESYLEFVLRSAILNADEHQLGVISKEYQKPVYSPAISASAKLKQTRLKLGMSDLTVDTPKSSFPKSRSVSSSTLSLDIDGVSNSVSGGMKLSMRLLTLGRAARSEPHRTLALYDRRTVLLEWKYVTSMDNLTIAKRVDQVATLLHDIGPALHSLQCRGFVRDPIAKRYGYIFDLPDELNSSSHHARSFDHKHGAQSQPVTQMKSLRQMFAESKQPSLNMRLSLAVRLLETVLNLHTSGWLHKQFRSDNILFLRRMEEPGEPDKDNLSTYSVYIAGYVYSRLDSPGEMTEPLRSEFEADLYRHPSLLSNARQPYRKSFDIFSVACTLLEIGLWSSLSQILENHSASTTSTELSRAAERARSEPNIARSEALRDTGSETPRFNNSKDTLDLLALKHDLLCFQFPDSNSWSHDPTTRASSLEGVHHGEIMSSLESIVGKRYAAIVEELLAAGGEASDDPMDEHENALDLEMRVRDALRAIADAI